jgi:hypothetical protein
VSEHLIVAAMLMSIVYVGCTGGDTTPDDADEEVGEAHQALPSCYNETTYYSDDTMTQIVGWCRTASICTGSATRCSGQKTAYYDVVHECC